MMGRAIFIFANAAALSISSPGWNVQKFAAAAAAAAVEAKCPPLLSPLELFFLGDRRPSYKGEQWRRDSGPKVKKGTGWRRDHLRFASEASCWRNGPC